jgi:hypothetical protein
MTTLNPTLNKDLPSYPAIELPSLRPTIDGVPFPGTEIPEIPQALEQVQQWIDAAWVSPDTADVPWVPCPDRPAHNAIYGPVSLNTGVAGVIWYLLVKKAAGLDVEGDQDRLNRLAQLLIDSWREHEDDSPFPIPGVSSAYYGGLAGIAAVMSALALVDGSYRSAALELAETIVARINPVTSGWTGYAGFLGDGGIIASLLAIADNLGESRYAKAALDAGEWLLAQERAEEHGSSWPGVDISVFSTPESPLPPQELDGFELGTVGVVYVLAALFHASNDERFALAAVRGAQYLAAESVVQGDVAYLLTFGGRVTFGYCTGLSGVIRAWVAVYHITGDAQWLEWALRYGRAILRSGIFMRRTAATETTLHQCCGSAAILETLIGLWRETGDDLWLRAAQTQGDDILICSTVDERGRRWYSASHTLGQYALKAEVGHQVGASGIAVSLVRLHQIQSALQDNRLRTTIRLPDDPYALCL